MTVLGPVLRRALWALPVAFGALTLLFLVFFLLPGDPVDQLAGPERTVSPAVRRNVELKYGLDRPWYVQYGRYVRRLASGDLGRSHRSDRPVSEVMRETAPASLRLATWALVVEVAVGVAVGVVAVVRRTRFVDALTQVSTAVVLAVPVFVLGYVLQLVLGVYTFQHDFPPWARFPVQGIGPDSWTLLVVPTGSQWRSLVLPVVTLASVSTAVVARLMRATMVEITDAGYLRTAAAKGLSQSQVLVRHGVRNALVPVVTFVALELANLIGSAVLTETVFNWPGLGSALTSALQARDAPVVLGLSLVVVLAYVVVNLVADVAHVALDPRLRQDGEAR